MTYMDEPGLILVSSELEIYAAAGLLVVIVLRAFQLGLSGKP
jgi:hypothetical protein